MEFLIKLGAPVVLVLLSRVLDIFVLPAPGSWLPGIGDGLRYLTPMAGAAAAHRIAGPNPRAFTILCPIMLVIGGGFGFEYLIQHPPTVSEKTLWAVLMAVTFVLTYFFVGFVVSVVVAAIWPRPRP